MKGVVTDQEAARDVKLVSLPHTVRKIRHGSIFVVFKCVPPPCVLIANVVFYEANWHFPGNACPKPFGKALPDENGAIATIQRNSALL